MTLAHDRRSSQNLKIIEQFPLVEGAKRKSSKVQPEFMKYGVSCKKLKT